MPPGPACPSTKRPSQPLGVGVENGRQRRHTTGEFREMVERLDELTHRVDANLRFTKAIYRGTKKSFAWPGFESKIMNSRSKSVFDFGGMSDDHIIAGDMSHTQPISSQAGNFTAHDIDEYPELTGERLATKHASLDKTGNSISEMASVVPNESDGEMIMPIRKELRTKSNLTVTTVARSKRSVLQSDKSTPSTLCSAIVESLKGDTTRVDIDSHQIAIPHRATTMKELTQMIKEKNSIYEQRIGMLWTFLEDRHSGKGAYLYYCATNVFLLFAILVAIAEIFEVRLVSSKYRSWGTLGNDIQIGIELVFALELALRFYTCRARLYFFHNVYNAIDLISVGPLVLRALVLTLHEHAFRMDNEDTTYITAFLGVVPVFRSLRLLRHFETFQLLMHVFMSLLPALPMLMFILVLVALTFGAIIFYCEPRASIPSLPLSLYFAIVSLSTVGYGDITPTSDTGRIWTTLLIIIGPMYMAIPIGIIGNSFSEVWENRFRLLLLQRMRNCVTNAGYSRKDLHRMFTLLDTNGDGTLDYDEFVGLLEIMKLNVGKQFVEQLFETFDAGDEGSIDFQELLYGLFRQH